MRFVLTIDCDNAAFPHGEPHPKVSRILKEAARDVDKLGERMLFDINGNRVGEWKFIDD